MNGIVELTAAFVLLLSNAFDLRKPTPRYSAHSEKDFIIDKAISGLLYHGLSLAFQSRVICHRRKYRKNKGEA